MADITPVPTLSTDGWLTTTSSRADALFSDFIVANYSQCPQIPIESSLPWLITRHQGDIRGLESSTARVLTSYFERFFPQAKVVCYSKDNPSDAGQIDLYINLTLTDEAGESFILGKIATVGEQRVIKVATENNGSLPSQA